MLAVINRREEDGNIPRTKWSATEYGLWSVFFDVLEELPGPAPDFVDTDWYQGRIKVIRFNNMRSVECYRCALEKIGEIWPDAAVDVVNKEYILSRPRANA